MAAPVLTTIYPADASVGVILSDVIYVIFDQEVDRSTVELIVEGPDTDMWSGPDLGRWDDPSTTADDDLLANPGYSGIVPGTLTFAKDGGSVTAEVSTMTLPAFTGAADGDYIVLHDPVGIAPSDQWAVALDTTGTAAQTPTGAVWLTVPAAQRVYLDVSTMTTAIEMAAAVYAAFNTLVGFTNQVGLVDNLDGTVTATVGNAGPCTDAEVHTFDDGGVGSITVVVDTQGANEAFDTVGNGALWQTQAIFTPEHPMQANTAYRAYIVGDEQAVDDIHSGVSTRTVFDTVVGGANTGTGEVFFGGGYNGPTTDSIHVRILEAGLAGNRITFEWWRGSSPLLVSQLTTRESSQPLTAGVTVRFAGGAFAIGDEFDTVNKPAEYMANTFAWDFETGSGSIQAVPSGVQGSASSPVAAPSASPAAGTAGFTILSVDPKERATHQSVDTTNITVIFSEDIDPATVNDDSVFVWTEPVNGDFVGNNIQFRGELQKRLVISGATLRIELY